MWKIWTNPVENVVGKYELLANKVYTSLLTKMEMCTPKNRAYISCVFDKALYLEEHGSKGQGKYIRR